MRISGEHGISDDYSIMRVKRANWGEMKGFSLEHGRGARIRTGDLLNPIQTRYQAALRPVKQLGGQQNNNRLAE